MGMQCTSMSAGVWNSPFSLTERMLSRAEDRLLKDMVDVQLIALFTKDLPHSFNHLLV